MNSKIKIIGLSGKKQSGKSTVAAYMTCKYGYIELAFADTLKLCLSEIFHLSYEQLYGDQKEVLDSRYNVSPRELMQVVGTDLFRKSIQEHLPKFKCKYSVWINNLDLTIQKLYELHSKIHDLPLKIVVSDVRFEDEERYLVDTYNADILYLSRNDIQENAYSSHISEQSINMEHSSDTRKIIIPNNGTVEQLYEQLDKYMNKPSPTETHLE